MSINCKTPISNSQGAFSGWVTHPKFGLFGFSHADVTNHLLPLVVLPRDGRGVCDDRDGREANKGQGNRIALSVIVGCVARQEGVGRDDTGNVAKPCEFIAMSVTAISVEGRRGGQAYQSAKRNRLPGDGARQGSC